MWRSSTGTNLDITLMIGNLNDTMVRSNLGGDAIIGDMDSDGDIDFDDIDDLSITKEIEKWKKAPRWVPRI